MKRNKNRVVSPTYYVSDIYPLHNLLAAAHLMSESALRVANYIIENPQGVASMSIGDLAKATSSNKSAVVRVSKLSGYTGYRGLRAALIENKGVMRGAEMMGDRPSRVGEADNFVNLARAVVKINIEVAQDTLTLLDEGSLLRAVESILRAKHVFLVGFGASTPVVQDAYQRLLGLDVPSSTCTDAHNLANIVENAGPEDLLFCISHSGAGREIVEALKTARRRNAPTITLTSAPKSTAVELSDVSLISAVRRRPSTTDSGATRVAQLVIVDVICAIIALNKSHGSGGATERIAGTIGKVERKRGDSNAKKWPRAKSSAQSSEKNG
jgi:RpiR family carbohydrate utilization transcriptional regulator